MGAMAAMANDPMTAERKIENVLQHVAMGSDHYAVHLARSWSAKSA